MPGRVGYRASSVSIASSRCIASLTMLSRAAACAFRFSFISAFVLLPSSALSLVDGSEDVVESCCDLSAFSVDNWFLVLRDAARDRLRSLCERAERSSIGFCSILGVAWGFLLLLPCSSGSLGPGFCVESAWLSDFRDGRPLGLLLETETSLESRGRFTAGSSEGRDCGVWYVELSTPICNRGDDS